MCVSEFIGFRNNYPRAVDVMVKAQALNMSFADFCRTSSASQANETMLSVSECS